MPTQLEIDVTREGDARRFALSGRVDAAQLTELTRRLWTEGDGDTETVILDLRSVTFIDVSSLAALFSLKDLLGRRLRIQTRSASRSNAHARERGVSRVPLARR